jgi:hypothetical protein
VLSEGLDFTALCYVVSHFVVLLVVGSRPPHFECFYTIRHNHPVGLLYTRDQLVAEAATSQHNNKKMNIQHSCGFRTGDCNILTGAELQTDCTGAGY